MALPTTLSIFSGTVTTTGATAAVSTSGLSATSHFTLQVQVTGLTETGGSPRARITIEDSPDGTTWTALAVYIVSGTVAGAPNSFSDRNHRIPGLKMGASAKIRANITELSGTSPSLSFIAQLM